MIQENRLSSGFWVFIINVDDIDICYAMYNIFDKMADLDFKAIIALRSDNKYFYPNKVCIISNNKYESVILNSSIRPIFLNDHHGKWIQVKSPIPDYSLNQRDMFKNCTTFKTIGISPQDILPFFNKIKQVMNEN